MALTPSSLPSGTASGTIVPAQGEKIRLCGWAASEDAGATARVQILDGPGGNLVVPFDVPINGTIRETAPSLRPVEDTGIAVTSGQLYVNRISGTTTVAVYWAAA